MVKVNRKAAFEVGGEIFTDIDEARRCVRKAVIMELMHPMDEQDESSNSEELIDFIVFNWKQIEQKTEAAFAGI